MKVLWITNILMPPLSKFLDRKPSVMGGWMYSSLKALISITGDLKFAIASTYSGKKLLKQEINGVVYYLLPLKHFDLGYYPKELEKYWKLVKNDFCPDVVHIHGTEYCRGLSYLNACGAKNCVVSIQGMTSICAEFYTGNLSNYDILKNLTWNDVLLRRSIWHSKAAFRRSGCYENKLLQRIPNVIGRTSWDKVHTLAVNSQIKYFSNNETLRDPFYQYQWKYVDCEKYTIFISQAGYPLKGFHQLLLAMPLILRQYPEAKIYVAGPDLLDTSTFYKSLRLNGYGRYLKHLIHSLGIENKVNFIGFLDTDEMCQQYLRSNIFVSPSIIENSPNSLCEAQILGMPFVASYVGGVPDFMKGFEEYMYRYEDIEMLAYKICQVFSESIDWNGSKVREIALIRHNKEKNAQELLNIYKQL